MRALLASLGLLLVTLLLCASAAEVVLRLRYGPPLHFKHPQPRYLDDPQVGHRLEPGQRTFNHDEPLRVNAEGVRGPEYAAQPPAGTRRILALGDSQTFGNGLAFDETWPAQLEQRLDAAGGRWQVINGGLAGTDTWQHERILARLAGAYAFHELVLGFYVNDVTSIYPTGSAQELTNTWSKRVAYLLKRSALVTALWQTFEHLTLPAAGSAREQRILTGDADARLEAAWEQVASSLAAMRERTRARGAGFTLLVIPRRDQVVAADPPTAYNRRAAAVAAELGIPVVDVLEPLRRAHAEVGDALFIPWDGHNSAVANRVIAEALAEHFR